MVDMFGPLRQQPMVDMFGPLIQQPMVDMCGPRALHSESRRGRDRMVVGFTTTCAISAYHH
jgi:hypothetical protein